jgi:hypothetical protein
MRRGKDSTEGLVSLLMLQYVKSVNRTIWKAAQAMLKLINLESIRIAAGNRQKTWARAGRGT